ncbi:hypothetical protein C7212DRAFT_356864 [Tuber magnatum]|uniref:Uncharacterized protein n=1 Tax=Tuber magnatum TaxID=42249 RepID=A0A317SX94_9PEZI|nr:hypothetical protein C7212DRAFT_356864 [Tuber magnatum]
MQQDLFLVLLRFRSFPWTAVACRPHYRLFQRDRLWDALFFFFFPLLPCSASLVRECLADCWFVGGQVMDGGNERENYHPIFSFPFLGPDADV